MKIAVIAPSTVPSNTANSIQVMKVCQSMVDLGHEVRLWIPGKGSVSWDELAEFYGISSRFPIEWIPNLRYLRRYDMGMIAVLRAWRWKAEVIYTWMPQVAVFGSMIQKPVILEVHMLPGGLLGKQLFRIFLRSKTRKRILIITQALKNLLEQALSMRIPSGITQIAPMGFDAKQYENLPQTEVSRRQLGIDAGGIIASYTGHLYAGRGMDILYQIAEAYPNIQFLWVGGRSEDVRLWKSKIEQAGLRNITLTGFVPNSKLPLYQSASDILLMPYERVVGVSSRGNTADYCSPMKMFDYLAAGKPILASDLPVFHEVLNSSNAVFCSPSDINAWIDTFGKLVEDMKWRQGLSQQAKEDSRKYSWLTRSEKALRDFI